MNNNNIEIVEQGISPSWESPIRPLEQTPTELLNDIFENRHKDDWGVLITYPGDAERLKKALEGIIELCYYAPHDSGAVYEVDKDDILELITEALGKDN